MKAVVAAFNQEKALVGAFSMIVQLHRLIDLRHYYEAMHKLHYTSVGPLERGPADGMGPLIRLGIKLLFIYSVDKMLPRLIVVGEGNIADCCH